LAITSSLAVAGTIPTVSIEPSTTNVTVGNIVSLNINISGVTDLYGFQLDLAFTPTTLTADTLLTAVSGVTGSGTLAIVQFDAISLTCPRRGPADGQSWQA
jgi:hypothetical protein